MTEPIIQMKNIEKHFGSVIALGGVSLDVVPGKCHCLLGDNGAGKSTLIKSLVGRVKPVSGKIEVLGYEMPRAAREARKRLGYMPQIPAIYGDLSVRANVRFFAGAHKLDDLEEKVDRALMFVGMDKFAERKSGTLSGGLKQRCSLACALVHEPDLLLLDEPTAGVDPILKEGFWNHFRELVDRGKTIIISTHLMDEPLSCDKIGILREGRLIIEDTPENILAMGKTLVEIDVGGDIITEQVDDYRDALPPLLSKYGLKSDVKRISLKHESLEDVFHKLVKEDGDEG